jgi:Cu2+-containing amine oxidase
MTSLLGMPFSKIRYLGRSVVVKMTEIEDGAIVVDGTSIPLTLDNKDEIEAAMDALKETSQREKIALQEKIKKLKKEKNAVVQEENIGLKRENEALISENTRLKVFDPKDKDRTWSVKQMKKIQGAAAGFISACRLFVLDERIDQDFKLQAEVEGYMTQAELGLQELRRLWTDRFLVED